MGFIFAQILIFSILGFLIIIPIVFSARMYITYPNQARNYVSAWAGTLIGHLIFVLFVVWQRAFSGHLNPIPDAVAENTLFNLVVDVLAIIGGLTLGFSFLSFILPVFYAGILNLLVTAAATIAMYNVFILGDGEVFFTILGVSFACGTLLYVLFNPGPFREIYRF